MKRTLAAALAAASALSCAAATNSTMATRNWVRDYVATNCAAEAFVRQAVAEALRASAADSVEQKQKEICDADVSETISVVSTNPLVWAVSEAYATDAGGVGVTQRLFRVETATVYEAGEYAGGVVKSSSIAAFPTGMVFAAAGGDSFVCAATNLPGDTLWATDVPAEWTISSNAVAGAAGCWEWKFAPEDAPTNGVAWTWEDLGTDVRAIAYTNVATCATNVINGVTNVVLEEKRVLGSFTLTPARLSAAQQIAATGEEEAGAAEPEPAWCARFPRRATSSAVTLTPCGVDGTTSASGGSSANASGGSSGAAGSSASGANGGATTTTLTIPSTPIVPKDWHGVDGGDFYWTPKDWWEEATWNAESSWVALPATLSVFIGHDESGNAVYKPYRFRSLAQMRVAGVAVPPIPPTPYAAPRKIAIPKCDKIGHEWKDCVCQKCGARRAHFFEPVGWNGSECAKCKNKNTKWTRNDETGEYEVKEAEECGNGEAANLPDDPAYHAGWHGQGSDAESEYHCACACGKYGIGAIALRHELEDTGEYEQIGGDDGETQHYALRECSRCGTTQKQRRYHAVDTSEEAGGYYEGIDSPTHHRAHGPCSQCGKSDCNFLQTHEVYLAGKTSCLCCCGETHHTDETGGVSEMTDCQNIECGRCGENLSGGALHLFDGGPQQKGHLGEAWQIDPIEGPYSVAGVTVVAAGSVGYYHLCNCGGTKDMKSGSGIPWGSDGALNEHVAACTATTCRNGAGRWGYFCFHCGRNMDSEARTWDSDPDEEDPDCPYGNPKGRHDWPSGLPAAQRHETDSDGKCKGCGESHPLPHDHGHGTFSESYPITWGWEIESDEVTQNEDGTYTRTVKYHNKVRFKWGYYTDDAHSGYVVEGDRAITTRRTETHNFSM